jgi:hypothetical protein
VGLNAVALQFDADFGQMRLLGGQSCGRPSSPIPLAHVSFLRKLLAIRTLPLVRSST